MFIGQIHELQIIQCLSVYENISILNLRKEFNKIMQLKEIDNGTSIDRSNTARAVSIRTWYSIIDR